MGSGGIGSKSAFVIQFIQNHFVTHYDPTIEDSYRTRMEDMMLDIMDTSGQEEYKSMHPQWVERCNVMMIGFSVISGSSFDQVKGYVNLARRYNKPFILVGNKVDVEDERIISTGQGIALARELNCPYIETSARFAYNVVAAFCLAIDYLYYFKYYQQT